MLVFLILLAIIATCAVYLRGSGVPVFLYHQVNEHSNIDRELFEKHLDYIHAQNLNTFTFTEARDRIARHGMLPQNSLLITFDDGYYDNYRHVFPLLKKYGIKATFFLNTMFIQDKADRSSSVILHSDEANRNAVENYYRTGDGRTDQYMTWEEIREMQASGLCDFQAHTHVHKMAVASLQLKSILSLPPYSREIIQLFDGRPEEGLPVFRFRGETTVSRFMPSEKFMQVFRGYYQDHLRQLNPAKRMSKAKDFIKTYKNPIAESESLDQAEHRIRTELRTNKEIIEKNLKTKVFAFAWPYGHKGKFTREFIRKEEIYTFVSCKKGTNRRKMDFDLVRRIELRKPTLENFKFAVRVNLNLLTGKIYEFFT
ncbi:MAG: polysaccharide deacetylase family protein [Cytophagaceae bacterium]